MDTASEWGVKHSMTINKATTNVAFLLVLGCISLLAQTNTMPDRNLKENVRQIVEMYPKAVNLSHTLNDKCDALAKRAPSTLTAQERAMATQCPGLQDQVRQVIAAYEVWRGLYSDFRTCQKDALSQNRSSCSTVRQRLEDQTVTFLRLFGTAPTSPEAQFYPGRWFKNGLAPARILGKYGFIDETGKVVIQPKYEFALEFSEGVAAVLVANPDSKWGFIDTKGQFVIPPQIKCETIVNWPSPFSEGLATFYEGDSIGYINRTGQVVIRPQFEHTCPFSGNQAVVLRGGQKFIIDRSGKTVMGPLYVGLGCFSEEVVAFNSGHGWGYMDRQGKIVIPNRFEFANEFSEGLAAVKVNGECAYINKTGKTVIPPFPCELAGEFKEGLAKLEIKPLSWGYMDKTGKFPIPPQFTNAEDFSEGLAHVEVGYKHEFIDQSGRMVLSSVGDTEDWPTVP